MPFGSQDLIKDLEERKTKEFNQYRYYLGEYKIYQTDTQQIIVNMISIPIDDFDKT